MVEGDYTAEDFLQNNYYSNISDPNRVVYLMNLFSDQEVAIKMGYVILSKAEGKIVLFCVKNVSVSTVAVLRERE